MDLLFVVSGFTEWSSYYPSKWDPCSEVLAMQHAIACRCEANFTSHLQWKWCMHAAETRSLINSNYRINCSGKLLFIDECHARPNGWLALASSDDEIRKRYSGNNGKIASAVIKALITAI
ncbi:unnamed protein product [Brugia pahangi]|uniref:RNase H domain-containing protein n=1 Tax=Brugia pahangi TaxID=6280 RepID=A0A0N4THI8_BRUPA|nr:unnamed protein product [Brugia pahangi]